MVIVALLVTDPDPKRRIFFVPSWHHAMAMFPFEVNQLFMLLAPEHVVWFVGALSFPNEPNFVQNSLLVWSNFVALVIAPLVSNLSFPWRLVLVVTPWDHTMVILLFELKKLFMLHVPRSVVMAPKRHF
jgi:hypothetical protein